MRPIVPSTRHRSATELFTGVNEIIGEFSDTAPAVAAAANDGMVIVHRARGTDNLVFNSTSGGVSGWGSQRSVIEGGWGPQLKTRVDPTIAGYGDHVHLIYQDPTTHGIRWSYWDSYTWSPSTELPSRAMSGGATLAASTSKMVMTHTSSNGTPAIYYATFQ